MNQTITYYCDYHQQNESYFLNIQKENENIKTQFLCRRCTAKYYMRNINSYLIDIEQVFDKDDMIFNWPPLKKDQFLRDLANIFEEENNLHQHINQIQTCVKDVKDNFIKQLDILQKQAIKNLMESSSSNILKTYNNLIERENFKNLILQKQKGEDQDLKEYVKKMFKQSQENTNELLKSQLAYKMNFNIKDQIIQFEQDIKVLFDTFQKSTIDQNNDFLKEINLLLFQISDKIYCQWDSYQYCINGIMEQKEDQNNYDIILFQNNKLARDQQLLKRSNIKDIQSMISQSDENSWYISLQSTGGGFLCRVHASYYKSPLPGFSKTLINNETINQNQKNLIIEIFQKIKSQKQLD